MIAQRRVLSLISALVLCLGLAVFALNAGASAGAQDLYAGDLDPDEAARLIESYGFAAWERDSRSRTIECFDVSEDNRIAVGWAQEPTDGKKHHVSVFDGNMQPICGCEFTCYGSFVLFWDGELLAVHPLRGDAVFLLDSDSSVVAVKKASKSLESFGLPGGGTEKAVGNRIYRIEGGIFSFGRLTVEDPSGVRVLYDAGVLPLARTIVLGAAAAAGAAVCIMVVVKRIKAKGKPSESRRT